MGYLIKTEPSPQQYTKIRKICLFIGPLKLSLSSQDGCIVPLWALAIGFVLVDPCRQGAFDDFIDKSGDNKDANKKILGIN